jgi:glutathione S-transferase
MPTIKFYYSPGACSIASHILLREIGASFEGIEISVKAGAPEELRGINPKMRVPVLSIDDQIITETPAIMTAISQLLPDKYLMGRSNLETVRVYEWLNWLSGTLHGQAFGGLFRPYRYSDDPNAHPSIKAKSRKTVEECFDKIELDISGTYALGGGFTVVDPFLYVFYRWGASLGMEMKRYPRWRNLIATLGARQSFQTVLKAEGVNSYVPKL